MFGEYLYLRAVGVDMVTPPKRMGSRGTAGWPGRRRQSPIRVRLPCRLQQGAQSVLEHLASFTRFDSTPPMKSTLLMARRGFARAASRTLANGDFRQVFASYDIGFKLVDMDYNWLLYGSCAGAVNYTLGARYAHLRQSFEQDIPDETTVTTSKIDFDGVGLRSVSTVTGRSAAVAGYLWQGLLQRAVRRVHQSIQKYGRRLLSLSRLDTTRSYPYWTTRLLVVDELQWSAADQQRLLHRLLVQYDYTADYIRAVQNTPTTVNPNAISSFSHLGDTIAFTGLTSKLEYRSKNSSRSVPRFDRAGVFLTPPGFLRALLARDFHRAPTH